MSKKYTNLRDFYPYYLTEHRNPVCRGLHFVGTALVIGILAYCIASAQYHLLWLCFLAGYGFAWVGHFVFERNRPATFVYPLMSFTSDFIMFYHILTGQLPRKLAEAERIIANESNS